VPRAGAASSSAVPKMVYHRLLIYKPESDG